MNPLLLVTTAPSLFSPHTLTQEYTHTFRNAQSCLVNDLQMLQGLNTKNPSGQYSPIPCPLSTSPYHLSQSLADLQMRELWLPAPPPPPLDKHFSVKQQPIPAPPLITLVIHLYQNTNTEIMVCFYSLFNSTNTTYRLHILVIQLNLP